MSAAARDLDGRADVFQNSGNGLLCLSGTVEVRTMEGTLVGVLTATNAASPVTGSLANARVSLRSSTMWP